jgi:carbon monoxide dehydrogenase subunit G
MRVERSIEIAAPPERVYDLVMDPARLADWVTIHHHLVDAPNGPLKQGSRLTQSLRLAGRRFTVRWTVVENDPCKRVVWEGKGPVASHARVVYGFHADGDADRTNFSYTNEYDLPGGPLGKVAGRAVARITQKELEGSLQRLKSLVE